MAYDRQALDDVLEGTTASGLRELVDARDVDLLDAHGTAENRGYVVLFGDVGQGKPMIGKLVQCILKHQYDLWPDAISWSWSLRQGESSPEGSIRRAEE